MDINSINFNGINKIGLKSNISKNKIVNFSSRDIVDFSEATKVRSQTIKDLKEVGYSAEEANELINKYSKTEKFKELTEGTTDDLGWLAGHSIDKISDRNLTQSETILYLAHSMDDYYLQHSDLGCMPSDYLAGSVDSEDYDIGKFDIMPLDFAKQIKKGFDIEVAGMILKGKITEEQASKMKPFYDETLSDRYSYNKNVQHSEYTIEKIIDNLDKAEALMSEKKDENGNLVSGFTRPLKHDEAVALITNDYLPRDTTSINNYIALNNEYGCSIFEVDTRDLWDKTVEDIEKEQEAARAKQLEREDNNPTEKEIKTIDDAISVVRDKNKTLSDEKYDYFFEDLADLDSEKFLKKLTLKQIKFDAMHSILEDREQRKENIKAMNLMSEELISKITQTDDGKTGKFATLSRLFTAEKLEEKVKNMEEFRTSSPQLFANMTKEAVLDYLIGSNFYSDLKHSREEFLEMLYKAQYGLPLTNENNNQEAKIFEFPKKDEE